MTFPTDQLSDDELLLLVSQAREAASKALQQLDDVVTLVYRARESVSMKQLATAAGYSEETVRSRLRTANVSIRPRGNRPGRGITATTNATDVERGYRDRAKELGGSK